MKLRCTHWVRVNINIQPNQVEMCGKQAIQFLEVLWPEIGFKALCKKHSENYRNYEFFKKITPEEYVVGKIMII
jgi:hypothetical protein